MKYYIGLSAKNGDWFLAVSENDDSALLVENYNATNYPGENRISQIRRFSQSEHSDLPRTLDRSNEGEFYNAFVTVSNDFYKSVRVGWKENGYTTLNSAFKEEIEGKIMIYHNSDNDGACEVNTEFPDQASVSKILSGLKTVVQIMEDKILEVTKKCNVGSKEEFVELLKDLKIKHLSE